MSVLFSVTEFCLCIPVFSALVDGWRGGESWDVSCVRATMESIQLLYQGFR